MVTNASSAHNQVVQLFTHTADLLRRDYHLKIPKDLMKKLPSKIAVSKKALDVPLYYDPEQKMILFDEDNITNAMSRENEWSELRLNPTIRNVIRMLASDFNKKLSDAELQAIHNQNVGHLPKNYLVEHALFALSLLLYHETKNSK